MRQDISPGAAAANVLTAIGRFLRRTGLIRLLIFCFVLVLAYAGPFAFLQLHVLPHVAKDLKGIVSLAAAVLTSMLGISVYALLVGWLERRDITELHLRRGVPLLTGGVVLAAALFCIAFAVLFAAHAAVWNGFGGTQALLPMLAMAIVTGVCEELIFRGAIYRIVEDMFGTAIALVFSGILFGLVHLGNPNATFLAGAAIAIEAGILLGAAYTATRNLWLPIGIHIGWNFAEGGIFGAAVSGGEARQGLLDISLNGPDWLTGGAFGPEASVVPLILCTAVGVYFVVRTFRSGRWCRIGFRMMLD